MILQGNLNPQEGIRALEMIAWINMSIFFLNLFKIDIK